MTYFNPTLDGIQIYLLLLGGGGFHHPLLNGSKGLFWGQMRYLSIKGTRLLNFRLKKKVFFSKGSPKQFFCQNFNFFFDNIKWCWNLFWDFYYYRHFLIRLCFASGNPLWMSQGLKFKFELLIFDPCFKKCALNIFWDTL